jgi:RNA polymerase sigma-70 factor (ECF subfamily)
MSEGVRENSPGVLRLVPRAPGAAAPSRRMVMDDEALVAAVRSGDTTVASTLCDRLWPQVDRTIRRLVGHRDADRDDLAQLALIELVKTIGRYRADCSLDTWAQAVTANVVWKHLRRRRVERRIFADIILDDDLASAPVQVERRSATREMLERIAQHLEGMNEGRAWAYVLHDLLGYDLREVAEMTNTSVAATQSRLSRGRRELHERIAEDPGLIELLRQPEASR